MCTGSKIGKEKGKSDMIPACSLVLSLSMVLMTREQADMATISRARQINIRWNLTLP